MTVNPYYTLRDRAHALWMQAQDKISQAEDRFDYNNMTAEETEQWYAALADARILQEQAMDLEKQITVAQVDMWREQYAEETARQNDYAELQKEQAELRHGG